MNERDIFSGKWKEPEKAEEKQPTYSVWWRTCPHQKLPSRCTVDNLTDANAVKVALEAKGWQAWWTLDEDRDS